MSRRRAAAFAAFTLVLFKLGCTPEPPPKTPPPKQDGVPANSLSDARMNGEEDPKDREKRQAAQQDRSDPTQPVATKVGDSPSESSSGGSGSSKSNSGSSSSSSSSSGGGGGKGAVSKAECDRVMDRYIDLEITKNPDLKGVPPEVIDQAKQMAREKHGEAPCTATRSQYTCAMSAASTAAWQKCMK